MAKNNIPAISGGLDHVHLYAPDRAAAAQWYGERLGFRPVEKYAFWAKDPHGPLTIEDPAGRIHFAIFRSEKRKTFSLAFGVTGAEYLAWRAYLPQAGLALREADHDKSWSLYFDDPFGNQLEITTYDYEAVSAAA